MGLKKPFGDPSEQHFAKDLAWENADISRRLHWFHHFEGKPMRCSFFSITCPQVATNVWRRHQIWFSFSMSIVYLNLNLILKGSFLNPIDNETVLALKEQYPITAHAPNFDFWTGCREIKRCENSKRTLKNPFASRLAEFNATLKLLRITDQWYIVPFKSRFGRNLDFLTLLLLPLTGGPKDGKRLDVDWRLISSASFHTSSDNCERNTQKWNSSNKDCKKETIETLMWLRRSYGGELREAECFATTR